VAVLELYKARSVKSPAARFTGFFHYIRRVFGFQLRSLPISFYKIAGATSSIGLRSATRQPVKGSDMH
jgi:hypothetical protein